MKLPLNNLNYPVKILIGSGSGSGFLIGYEKKIYLVTAKHVIYQQNQITKESVLLNSKAVVVCHTFLDGNIMPSSKKYEIDLVMLSKEKNLIPHATADIVMVKLGDFDDELKINFVSGILITQQSNGAIVYYNMSDARNFKEAEITNEVFVLGYPVSLSSSEMKQIDYDSPLVRKGIIAGKNYKNKTIILDCPVYGGNSGGLVLEINANNNKIHLIGVVVQYVPFIDIWKNVRFPELHNTNYQNSGYSIALPVDNIFDLIKVE